MQTLRRFVAVGATATLLDVAVFVLLIRLTPLAVWSADVVAILVALMWSQIGHKTLTFAQEPVRRWYLHPTHYLGAAAGALLVDVVIVSSLAGPDDSSRWLMTVKAVGITGAFVVRSLSYRWSMFTVVRADQQEPARRPVSEGSVRLSLVIPAYFEADGIAATVKRVHEELGHLRDEGGFELVVVDDGSTDETAERARAAGADIVVVQPQNRGKGAAVRAGVLAASGRTIAFTDADLSYAPHQVLRLLEQVEAGWDVVVGSRKHTDTQALVAARRLREIGGRVVNLMTSFVLLGQYRDTQCGLKAFRGDIGRALFARMRVDGFAFDIELFYLCERFRLTLTEVPVEVVNHTRSTVHIVRDTSRLMRDLFRMRLAGRRGEYEAAGEFIVEANQQVSATN